VEPHSWSQTLAIPNCYVVVGTSQSCKPMVAQTHPMDSPEGLNDTDRELLDLLADGRHTTGSLADATEKTTNYVRDRLKLMRLNGWVRYYHQPTALHELVDDPRREVNDE